MAVPVILYRGTIEAVNRTGHQLGQFVTPIRNIAWGYALRTWLLWNGIERNGRHSAKIVDEFFPRDVGLPILETYESKGVRPDGSKVDHMYLLPANPLEYELLSTEALKPPDWPLTISGKHVMVMSLCPKVWSEECQMAIDTTGRVTMAGEDVADISYVHCTCFDAPPPAVHLLARRPDGPMTIHDAVAAIRHGGQ